MYVEMRYVDSASLAWSLPLAWDVCENSITPQLWQNAYM